MLKQPTRIFQIIGKQVISDRVIRFILHDNIIYSDGVFNCIHCTNASPYNGYGVGDYLGISIGQIEKSSYSSPPSRNVFADENIVKRVKKPPKDYNGFTLDDLEFGMGWMEEE